MFRFQLIPRSILRKINPKWIIFAGLIVGYIVICLFINAVDIHSQQVAPPEDKKIDAKMQATIIDSVTQALNEVYVFPDVAKKMEKHLRLQYKKKAYQNITSLTEFTQKLTEDLQEISHDKHLWVRFASDELLARFQGDTLTDEAKQRELEERQRDNFCFKEVKILEGNIGYVDFRCFSEATEAGPTAIAAMNFLAHTDAIIFDLRQNGGGNPSMIQLITSYFFPEPVLLNTFYIRKSDSTNQFWTQACVQGPRMTNTDLYVLTSRNTFSGAEEFTYNLKNMKRATIIGDTTGGGAHPIDLKAFHSLNVGMSLPFGRAVNPVTGTNWEGNGVSPDISVPQEKALQTAHLEAIKKIIERTKDEDRKRSLTWSLETMNVLLNPAKVDVQLMQKYAGKYGPRAITLENGELYYQREGRPKYKMVPMSQDTFIFDDLRYFRLKFVSDSTGRVTEVVGVYNDGHTDSSPRTSD
jgi:hypothetical protein